MEEVCHVPCPLDCKLSDWSPWSACSASCGSGLKIRSKWLREKPFNGGRPCPKLDLKNQVRCALPIVWASTTIWWIISEKRVMRIVRVYDRWHHDSDNRSCKLFHLGPLTHPFLLNAWNIPNGIYLSRLEIHFAFSARLTFNSLPFHRLMHASSLSAVYRTYFSLEAKIWTNTISSSFK